MLQEAPKRRILSNWIKKNAERALSLLCIKASANTAGKDYYVDAINGNDENDGTSGKNAWKTLEKVNGSIFGPGDKILFRCGRIWTGHLSITSSGAPGCHITYGSYGDGYNPVICGTKSEADKYVVYIRDKQYVEINGLSIQTNMTEPDSNYRTGVMIANPTMGTINHIHIRNCEISKIYTCLNPDAGARAFGGITITSWASPDSIFNDVLIDGNFIHDLNYCGIYKCTVNDTTYAWDTQTDLRSTNVKFSNNTIQNCKGDGIVIGNTIGGVCEHNLVINSPCSDDAHLAGIWAAYHDNCTYQFNEVYGISGGRNDCVAFDDDINSNNNVYQYNYSHNNLHGASMSMGHDKNGVFRYNISKDESPGNGGAGWGSPIPNNYNNVYYVSSGLSVEFGISGVSLSAKNNIFANKGNTRWDMSQYKDLSNNCFHGNITPSGINSIIADPLFKDPDSVGDGIESCRGFLLQSRSPCIGAGIKIPDGVRRDFFGNSLSGDITDVGVHQASK